VTNGALGYYNLAACCSFSAGNDTGNFFSIQPLLPGSNDNVIFSLNNSCVPCQLARYSLPLTSLPTYSFPCSRNSYKLVSAFPAAGVDTGTSNTTCKPAEFMYISSQRMNFGRIPGQGLIFPGFTPEEGEVLYFLTSTGSLKKIDYSTGPQVRLFAFAILLLSNNVLMTDIANCAPWTCGRRADLLCQDFGPGS